MKYGQSDKKCHLKRGKSDKKCKFKKREVWFLCLSEVLRMLEVRCGSCALRWRLGLLCEPWVEIYNVLRGRWPPYRWICQPVARVLGQARVGGRPRNRAGWRCVESSRTWCRCAFPQMQTPHWPISPEFSRRGMLSCIACRLASILKGMANIVR